MKNRSFTNLIVLSIFAIALPTLTVVDSTSTTTAAPITYFVEDLGTLPGDASSIAKGINASGQVVGWSAWPNGTRAFIYTDGVGMVALPGLPDRPRTYARRMNDFGQVIGTANAGGTDIGHAVRWAADGTIQDLGTLGTGSFSEALGINNRGEVVGYSYVSGGSFPIHAFLYSDAAGLVDLTPEATTIASAWDINDIGRLVGSRNSRAFRWSSWVFEDLGVLPGDARSFAFTINELSQVAGTSQSDTGNHERLFRFTDGVGMQDLGGAGEFNRAWGINNLGDVVGEGRATGGPKQALLYTDGAGLQSLRPLITIPVQWFLSAAYDINDAGQIVGHAFNNFTQQTRAVRLRPSSMGCMTSCLRSTNIRLSAKGRFGSITIFATWSLPTGAFQNQTATTDRKGIARFSTSDGLGTYTLYVTDIKKAGYSLDPFNSSLSNSITR